MKIRVTLEKQYLPKAGILKKRNLFVKKSK
jgi:hypothetical protein